MNRLINQRTGRHVLRNIIFSYLLILIVIVGIWTVSMRLIARVILSQNETIYKNVLEVLSMSMDKDLYLMERTALSIALSNELKVLLSSWQEERGDILQIRSLKENMADAMANQSVIANCFIYMRNKDYCIAYNTTGSTLTYYRTYIEDMNVSYENWMDWMNGINSSGYYLLETEDGERIYYAYLIPINSFRREGVIFLEMSKLGLWERLKLQKDSPDTCYELISANGTSILEGTFDAEDCQVIEVISNESGWTYRSYVQNWQFDRYFFDFTRLMLLGIAGIAVICVAALLISFRTNYLPLKKIINRLEDSMNRPKGKSGEYQYVWASFENLLLIQKKNQGELELNRKKLKSVYLQYLLSGRCRPESIHENDLKLFNLNFLEKTFCAVVFLLPSEDSAQNSGYVFRETGICPDGDFSLSATFARRQENALYYLWGLSEIEAKTLRDILFQIHSRLVAIGYDCHICVSNFHRGSIQAAVACEEASELVRFAAPKAVEFPIFLYEEYLRERKQNRLQENILEYIRANYDKSSLSVEDVCAALGKCSSGVNKQLKEAGCESVLYYINQVRVEEAKRIFRESGDCLSIKDVMLKVGYENQNTFTRVFKRYEGMTPGEYVVRNQNKV